MKQLCGWLAIPLFIALMAISYSDWDTDFVSFYAGAKLAGTGRLYSLQAVRNAEQDALRDARTASERKEAQVHAYIRPAFYAVLLEPLSHLSFRTASVVWQVSNVLAIGIFIWLWCRSAALSVVIFVPLWICLMLGQDAALLLMVFASSIWLLRRNKPLLAGLLLSLCAVKFHLFLLLPLPILAKGLWRLAAGLATGVAVLIALSFMVNGNWVPDFLAMVRMNGKSQEATGYMFNMTGLVWGLPLHWLWFALNAAAVTVTLWLCMRRMDIAEAMSLTLVAGVLISLHALMYDLVFFLPWITLHGQARALKFGAVILVAILTITNRQLFYLGPLIVLGAVAEDLWRNYRSDASEKRALPASS